MTSDSLLERADQRPLLSGCISISSLYPVARECISFRKLAQYENALKDVSSSYLVSDVEMENVKELFNALSSAFLTRKKKRLKLSVSSVL